MDIARKFAVIGLLLLATLVTGFGKSWNLPLFTIHKLLALAWVIYFAVVLYHAARPADAKTAYYAAIAVLAISVVALIASGAVLLQPNLDPTAWLALHRIATVFAVLAAAFVARLTLINRH